MTTLCEQLKQFTSSDEAKLLGLQCRILKQLEATGLGPKYDGYGEYVTYREDHVKTWAIQNVHAPHWWFNRFDDPIPRTVRRSNLCYNGRYYRLNHYEKANAITSD
jgi:hypothetical protein